MSSKLRRILTALSRPLRWLRIPPALFVGFLGLVALVTLIAVLVKPATGPGAVAATARAQHAAVAELSYSGLRDAMSARKVKSAIAQAGRVQGRGRPQGRLQAHRRLLADR